LKIDVEGHEMDVLAGAERMFLNRAIGLVMFEFGGCNIDTRTFLQEFFYFFKKRGMYLGRLTAHGYIREYEVYNEALEQFRTQYWVAFRSTTLMERGLVAEKHRKN
jgi:hypothetical protein